LNVSRWLIQKFDFNTFQNRREFYQKLVKEYNSVALFKTLPVNVVPLGFPVVINERDIKRNKLRKNNIFCPIHWKLNSVRLSGMKDSESLSEQLLTLPIKESHRNEQFSTYIYLVKEIL